MTDTISFLSQHGQIMQAIVHEIRALQLDGLPDAEIQVRDDYHDGVTPHQGVSVHEAGEGYDPGVIGFHDVSYNVAVTIATTARGDARKTNDLPQRLREAVRRRFQEQRLPVGESQDIRHHICKVVDGEPRNVNKFPDHKIQQMVIRAWNRESRYSERVRP